MTSTELVPGQTIGNAALVPLARSMLLDVVWPSNSFLTRFTV